MNDYTNSWESIDNIEKLETVVENSKVKPVLIFKHDSSSSQSIKIKEEIQQEENLASKLDLCIINSGISNDISSYVCELAGVTNDYPQVILFADGVTMYDESYEMISTKKIQLAIKIVNRTFKWMETRA